VIDSLKEACKDNTLKDTVTNENQPEDGDSSSESSEETRKTHASAKVTHKDLPQTKLKTSKSVTVLPPYSPQGSDRLSVFTIERCPLWEVSVFPS
jgi:hypothetical protein